MAKKCLFNLRSDIKTFLEESRRVNEEKYFPDIKNTLIFIYRIMSSVMFSAQQCHCFMHLYS